MKTQTSPTVSKSLYPLLSPKERLSLLESIRGMWKHRKSDVRRELGKLRQERERKLPSIR